MTRIRAWLRALDPGSVVVIVGVLAIFAAILLMPPLPATEPGVPPGSTIPYGQPDTMFDTLEGRVYTVEEALIEYRQRIAVLEARVEKLERSRR